MNPSFLHPLAQEGYIAQRLKESGYVISKINFTTWQILDVRKGLTYALILRNSTYYCLPLHGDDSQATAIQQLICTALRQDNVQI
jgi:hypothetical protein